MWQFTNDLAVASRTDERNSDKYRDILINWGSIQTANGSAIVKLGNTTVVSGITLEECSVEIGDNQTGEEIEMNILDDLNSLIQINVKFQPYCSFSFKIQANDQDMKESLIMSRHFRQLLENGNIFDLKQLISVGERHVISNRMYIEILIENYDGNAFDACNIALIASLIDCRLNDEKRLKIDNYPISTTFCFKKNMNNDDQANKEIIFQDPNLDDEKLSAGLFNITVNADTDQLILLNKTGGAGIDTNTLKECIRVACRRANTMKKLLKSKQTKLQ